MPLWRLLHRDWKPAPSMPLVRGKFDRIVQLCRGREVLDCGCVGDPIESMSEMEQTSHDIIARSAKRCVGIDLWKEQVERRQALGYDVRFGNVEDLDLEERFDVVVAADLIEHLSNPGRFLDRVWEHLRDPGLLCLVTPNAHGLNPVAKSMLGVRVQSNLEHTCWYDRQTLEQLLVRHGYRPQEWYWQDYRRSPLVDLVVRTRPNLAAHLIVISERAGRSQLQSS